MSYAPTSFKNLYLGHLAATIGGFAVIAAAMGLDAAMGRSQGDPPSPIALVLILIGAVMSIVGIVFNCMLMYRMWNQIQDGPHRTTPGTAVGLLFVPLFNLYWIFVAYYGLAVDLNRYTSQKQIAAPRVVEGLSMASCILLICTCIPCLGALVAIVYLPLALVSLWQMVDCSRAIAAAKAQGAAPPVWQA